MLKFVCRVCTAVARILDAFGTMLVCLILVSVVLEVISRYVFDFAYAWTAPTAANALAWLTLTGACSAVWKNTHFRVNFFRGRLRPRWVRRGVGILALVLTVVYGCVLTVSGRLLMIVDATAVVSGLELRQGLVYGVLPVVGILMVVFAIVSIAAMAEGDAGDAEARRT